MNRLERAIPTADVSSWAAHPISQAGTQEDYDLAAMMMADLLPISAKRELMLFQRSGSGPGFVRLRNCPIDESLSPTPTDSPQVVPPLARAVITAIAVRLGTPVGYLQEAGGERIQQIYPVRAHATRQTSKSSRSSLNFHVETAFHRYRPDYLLLLCLRSDRTARTLVSSIDRILPRLTQRDLDVLRRPVFETGVDESFLDGGAEHLGKVVVAPIAGPEHDPSIIADVDMMTVCDPSDTAAVRALTNLNRAIEASQVPVVLAAGDLVAIDNRRAAHGRGSFRARYDGSDRWLLRAFVVQDFYKSATARRPGSTVIHDFQ
jgi:L-asparagine oxygenase